MVKQISDNEIYLLIKYIKSVLWRVAKRLSHGASRSSETLMIHFREELHPCLYKCLPHTGSETYTSEFLMLARSILSRGLLRIIKCQFTWLWHDNKKSNGPIKNRPRLFFLMFC